MELACLCSPRGAPPILTTGYSILNTNTSNKVLGSDSLCKTFDGFSLAMSGDLSMPRIDDAASTMEDL